MHLWTLRRWVLQSENFKRSGIRFRYERSVDPEVKRACTEFADWLRSEYDFPQRVTVYVKGSETVRTRDGDRVVGSFFEPFSYQDEPYIRLAGGDYAALTAQRGKDNALASVLSCLAHELTHYYQWINTLSLTPVGRERQAARYARYILYEYSCTREHP